MKDTDGGLVAKIFPSELFYLRIPSFLLLTVGFAWQAKPITLAKPEVLLTGWSARCLMLTNGDGLADLVYFNLDKSYRDSLSDKKRVLPKNVRPVRKNRWERFKLNINLKEFLLPAVLLTIGDLILMILQILSQPVGNGVSIYFRENNASWSDALEIETDKIRPYSKSLQVINSHGRNDLYIFGGLNYLVCKRSTPVPVFPVQGGKRAYGIELIDINGDEILDWMYLIPGDDYSLKVRLGKTKGFGPELSFDIALASFPTFPVPLRKEQKFCD